MSRKLTLSAFAIFLSYSLFQLSSHFLTSTPSRKVVVDTPRVPSAKTRDARGIASVPAEDSANLPELSKALQQISKEQKDPLVAAARAEAEIAARAGIIEPNERVRYAALIYAQIKQKLESDTSEPQDSADQNIYEE